MNQPTVLDAFAGEGGVGEGFRRAGFRVLAVDNNKARLRRNPSPEHHLGDAIEFILKYGHNYDLRHGSPTCTGYSRGTVALPDRLTRYDRLIGITRAAFLEVGGPYTLENVEGARRELRTPILLCGRMFNLTAVDTDGTRLVMDRHRLFESNLPLLAPEHLPHDRTVQVAGSYGGARRDKVEARTIRKGGYVPSVEVQRALLGTPWMTEKGCQLSIPPAFTAYIGAQAIDLISEAAA